MSDMPEFGTVFWPSGNRTVPRVAEVGCDVCSRRRTADVTAALTKVRCYGKSGDVLGLRDLPVIRSRANDTH